HTRDCPTGGTDATHPCTPGGGACIDGSHVGVILVSLSPLTTGTASKTNATGNFCPGQSNVNGHAFGCFGSSACRTITENGVASGAISTGTPATATLAAGFCIGAAGDGRVTRCAALPGPGAVPLRGAFTVHNYPSGNAPSGSPPGPTGPGGFFFCFARSRRFRTPGADDEPKDGLALTFSPRRMRTPRLRRAPAAPGAADRRKSSTDRRKSSTDRRSRARRGRGDRPLDVVPAVERWTPISLAAAVARSNCPSRRLCDTGIAHP